MQGAPFFSLAEYLSLSLGFAIGENTHMSKKTQHRKADRHRLDAAEDRRRRPARKPANALQPHAGKAVRTESKSMPAIDKAALRLCPQALECGGCTLLGMPYREQLQRKQRYIASLYEGIAPAECLLEPIAGMEQPFGFRDKIASPFAPDRKLMTQARRQQGQSRSKHLSYPRKAVRCGLFAAGTHRIVPIAECKVEHPAGRRIIAAIQEIAAKFGIEPYDEDRQTGFLRYAVIRIGHHSNEVLVTLVTAKASFPGAKAFCRELVKRRPEVTSIVQNVNTQVTNAILGTEEHTLYGPGFILDTLCGLGFRISSRSFYQVNAVQTEVLYRIAMDYADLNASPSPVVIDAYCGTGTIGLVAASSAPGAHVIGVDKVASAIADARGNARHNGIGNAEFAAEDAGPFMRRLAMEGTSVDVLFMDPPRAGSTPEFIRSSAAMAPERIVYISCNPETQVRDIRLYAQEGYRLERIKPVDMFPHTDHVECVALMSRIR